MSRMRKILRRRRDLAVEMYWASLVTFLVCIVLTRSQKKCTENAQLNDEGECVCIAGYHGNGDFCCVPQDHKMCMVIGDPVLHAMNGDLIPLDLPCPTKISEIHTIGPKMDETVYLYVAGEYSKNGFLNYDYMRLEYWERYNDIHTEIDIVNGDITINKKKHDKNVLWSSPDYEIEAFYNSSTNSFTMLSMGTTRVTYIPPDHQKSHKPGLCVTATEESLLNSLGMCNQRKRGLQRSSINKGFDFLQAGVVEHLIRTMPGDQIFGPKDIQKTCLSIKSSRRPCGNKWNPAIKECFIVLSHTDIRLCLAVQNINILHVFQHCVRSMCQLEQLNGDALKQSTGVCTCVKLKPYCQVA